MAGLVRVDELIVRAYRKRELCRSLKEAVAELEKRLSSMFVVENDPQGLKFLKTILEANGYCVVKSDRLPFGIIALHPDIPNVIRFFVVRIFKDVIPRYPDEKAIRRLRQFSLYASGFIRGVMKSERSMYSTTHWILIATRGDRIVKVEDALSGGAFLR